MKNNKVSTQLPAVGFVRLPQILTVLPIGKSTWWLGVRTGRFPAPVKLGPRTTAWRVEDIRELILHANGVALDEKVPAVLQGLERERRESESCDAVDDIHQAALAEFDLDKAARDVLNAMYEASRSNYVATLKLLRRRREANPPWESAAQ